MTEANESPDTVNRTCHVGARNDSEAEASVVSGSKSAAANPKMILRMLNISGGPLSVNNE